MARTLGKYERFIGIDWSGAKGPSLKGLQVAICEPGDMPPALVPPLGHQYWGRTEIFHWIVGEAQRRRILVGLDFAFAYPYCDRNAYFPDSNGSPKFAKELWQAVDSVCQTETEKSLYGGFLYRDPRSPFYEYFWYPKHKGAHFEGKRLRRTDLACLNKTRPSCPFKCLGADQVGSGSAAGMRALHLIDRNYACFFRIWPFDHLANSKSTIVEIFPRLFLFAVNEDQRRLDHTGVTNAVLNRFGSKMLPRGIKVKSEDERDSIISAAAIRSLSSDIEIWRPEGLDEATRLHEGWIFGASNKA